ncbi:MAG: replicative DNA helicase [Bacteroidia bacterium]|nr:replicative DNA helicase [Bacteroidia bacterium]
MDKIPPQAIELEQSVLGCLMIEKKIAEVYPILRKEMFYKEIHQVIYDAICTLYHKNEGIDILTISTYLQFHNQLEYVGGRSYIAMLTNNIASTENLDHYVHIIIQQYLRREIVRIGAKSVNIAYDNSTDIFDTITTIESELFHLNGRISAHKIFSLDESLCETIYNVIENNNKKFTGVPSGFSELDAKTGGFHNSDMLILAARPGMGKSSCAFSIAYNAAKKFNKKILIFSLEMSSQQVTQKFISYETGIPCEKLRKGHLSDLEIKQINLESSKLYGLPIYICDTPILSVYDIKSLARQAKEKNKIDMVIIDYLQLINPTTKKNTNREQEVSLISRNLKAIAKELNIPLLALSQLSRSIESRSGDKIPKLSDLRESGSLEQDADGVFFIYRPEYYGEDNQDGKTIFTISKYRHGAIGQVELTFNKSLTLFHDQHDVFLPPTLPF